MATKQEYLNAFLKIYLQLQKIYAENPAFREDETDEDRTIYKAAEDIYAKISKKHQEKIDGDYYYAYLLRVIEKVNSISATRLVLVDKIMKSADNVSLNEYKLVVEYRDLFDNYYNVLNDTCKITSEEKNKIQTSEMYEIFKRNLQYYPKVEGAVFKLNEKYNYAFMQKGKIDEHINVEFKISFPPKELCITDSGFWKELLCTPIKLDYTKDEQGNKICLYKELIIDIQKAANDINKGNTSLNKNEIVVIAESVKGEKVSKLISFSDTTKRLLFSVRYLPMELPSEEKLGTYLFIYGSGQMSPGSKEDMGTDGLRQNAEAMRNKVIAKGVKKEQTHVLYAPTEKEFFEFIHKKYSTGKIRELYVYSHGTENSINLGGYYKKKTSIEAFENQTEDDRWVSLSDEGKGALPGENEILKIDRENFSKDAKIILKGCNMGGHEETQESKDKSLAQGIANHLETKESEVQAFSGSGSRYKQDENGNNIYNGEMIHSKAQKELLTIFKAKK